MRRRTLEELAGLMGGKLDGQVATDEVASGASIDTRTLRSGDLFFALPGTRTHGKQHAGAALSRGAAAVVVDEPLPTSGPRIVVDDVANAMARLAQHVRREESTRVPCAVITGSLGKTTTCRYASELLRTVGVAHRPPGSFNNHLGVPLTILAAPEECGFLIVEIGANRDGEVRTLAEWAQPKVACVTAIAPVHLDGFGDLDGVAREKLSILESLPEDGEGWLPVEASRRYGSLLSNVSARLRTFGRGGDLEITPLSAVPGRTPRYRLRFGHDEPPMTFEWDPPFEHSARNLEAALAVVAGLGVPPEAVLDQIGSLTLPPLRGEVREHGGTELILDCYNSSPTALESAIDKLEREPASGRRIAVLGTMEELGEHEASWHQAIGERLANSTIDEVFLMGRARDWFQWGLERNGRAGVYLDHTESSARQLAADLKPGDRVLFKASRSEALEEFAAMVAKFLDASESSAAETEHVVRKS